MSNGCSAIAREGGIHVFEKYFLSEYTSVVIICCVFLISSSLPLYAVVVVGELTQEYIDIVILQ